MTVKELQRGNIEEINIKEIKSVFEEASHILVVDFFLDESRLFDKYEIEYIATIIKAKSYENAKRKIREFEDNCKVILAKIKNNQDDLLKQYNSIINNVRAGDMRTNFNLMNLQSQGQNDQAKELFKNTSTERKKIMDLSMEIKKKYDDEVLKYKNKELELKEQLNKRKEELNLALDQDILTLLESLKHLVSSSVRNEEFFKGFILGNLTQVAYTFLKNIIDNIETQRKATIIIDELIVEINEIADKYFETLKKGFIINAEYLNQCYNMNKLLLGEIDSVLKNLPYEECESNKTSIENILKISTEKNFVYKNVLDPEKLNALNKEIEIYKLELQKSLNENHIILNNNQIIFDNINAQLTLLNTKHEQMVKKKALFLTPVYKELYFILRLLCEDSLFYMKDNKRLAGEISVEFHNVYKVQISEMVEEMQKTDMFTVSVRQTIDNNEFLDFLKYKEKLNNKIGDFNTKICDLDGLMVKVKDFPENSSKYYKKMTTIFSGIALIPIINVAISLIMFIVINKLKPAIKSDNPFYKDLFQFIMKRFKVNIYIHIGLAAVMGLISIPLKEQIWMFLVLAISYLISAIVSFYQKSNLKRFKDCIGKE